MDERLINKLADLERFGQENDQNVSEKSGQMLNITHETGEFLSLIVKITNSKNILEIGTSNGYSTIWLADAARKIGGRVTTLECDSSKIELAKQNFREAEVNSYIDTHRIKAEDFLRANPNLKFDFIFLDTDCSAYIDLWPDLQESVNPGGVLIVDDVTSHIDELLSFISLVKITSGFEATIVPVGNGELLIWKER